MDAKCPRCLTHVPLVLTVLSLITSIFLSISFTSNANETLASIQQQAQSETTLAIKKLNTNLQRIPAIAKTLTSELHNVKNDREKLQKLITQTLNNNPDLHGIGVAYQPYAFDETLRLYAPYRSHLQHSMEWKLIDDYYDYTSSEYSWYHNSLDGEARWIEPYRDQATQTNIIKYVAPVTTGEGEKSSIIGLLFIDYAVEKLHKTINSMDLGESGYSILISREGRLLSHPIQEYVDAVKNIYEIPTFRDDPVMLTLAEQAIKGNEVEVEHQLSDHQHASLVTAKAIPETGWSIISSFDKYPPLIAGDKRHAALFWLTLSWVITFVLLSPRLVNRLCANHFHSYWCSALFISTAFIIGIGVVWTIAYNASPQQIFDKATPITNVAELARFTNSYTEDSLKTNSSAPIYLPTGMFIQSIEFSSANNVVLTGYVWQRYALGIHDDLERGVVMPEAESLEMNESYHRIENEYEVIGWYFKATLRESFDYAHYPLDQQAVWIRLWHSDFDRNVVLVPDLEAYDHLNPRGLPGIEQDFVLPGWKLTQSYFEYRSNSYNSNFGIENYIGKNNFPELYFNIAMQRHFIDPFISNLAPVLVVLLMLFAIVITISKDDARINLLGFNASAILASCSALFFVVLIAHIDMRGSLEATSLIFMEDFYFLTYFSILMITVNSIIFTWGLNIKFITYQDNILPKISFWPLITGSMFLLSFLTFY